MPRFRTPDGVVVNIDDTTAAVIAAGWERLDSLPTPQQAEPAEDAAAETTAAAEDVTETEAVDQEAQAEPAAPKRRPGRPKKEAGSGAVS